MLFLPLFDGAVFFCVAGFGVAGNFLAAASTFWPFWVAGALPDVRSFLLQCGKLPPSVLVHGVVPPFQMMVSFLPIGFPRRYAPTLRVSAAPFQRMSSSMVAPERESWVSRLCLKR